MREAKLIFVRLSKFVGTKRRDDCQKT